MQSLRESLRLARNRILRRTAGRRDPVRFARALGVDVGERCRLLGVTSGTFGSEPYLISLGDHVTVTGGVRFVTHDGGVWILRDEDPDLDVLGKITVGSNVFIGLNTVILPGVTIGDNVVIGAGSVVVRDIPNDSIAAGVPARVVSNLDGYRRRAKEIGLPTKRMSPKEKRQFLLRHFNDPGVGRQDMSS